MTKRKKMPLLKTILALLLLFFVIVALFPFVYMVLVSLRQTLSLDMNFKLSEMNLINYSRIFRNFDFFRYFMNSIVVSVIAVVLNNLIASMAAYSFAKKKFPGANALFSLYLATLMIPGQVTIIPVFIIILELGLLNTYAAMSLPIVNAFGVFLIKQFMVTVPDELLEAANMDGSGEIRTFTSIVIPLIKPVLVALTVFTFITTWNNFLWPLIVATDTRMHTLVLALSVLSGNYATNYGLVMAGATLTFLVPFVLFIFLQKQFIEGIALSGLKV